MEHRTSYRTIQIDGMPAGLGHHNARTQGGMAARP